MKDDWTLLRSFLPRDGRELAADCGAPKELRKDKSSVNVLQVLLLHLAFGHSHRETVVRARQAGLADLSDIALMKRLRKSKDWLHALCVEFFWEHGDSLFARDGSQVSAFDATTVQEPGKTRSLWRLHNNVRLPWLVCDYFKVTETAGPGTVELYAWFPVRAGDLAVVDRGNSRAAGISLVASANGNRRERVCAPQNSDKAIKLAYAKRIRKQSKSGKKLRPQTLEYANYVILSTTFPESASDAESVLEWYRIRWQVGLMFKRFKSLARLGRLPKYNDESAKSWLYGTRFAALLVEKLIRHVRSVFHCRYELGKAPATRRVT